ncbi:MAG: NADH-quinone oxidoreductase subunit NuoF [bacterium]
MPETRILLGGLDIPNIQDIEVYIANGGYRALEKALRDMTPDEVIDEVKNSGLSGRGGAWFPTGVKWGFMPKEPKVPSYLCVNADESEPGTFRDRRLMEGNPHLVVEGTIISAYAIRASCAYIYIRGEMVKARRLLDAAIDQARAKGYIGRNILGSRYDLEVYTHTGAGAYICGEETALMESLEGKRGYPRIKPPFPAQRGIFGNPTTVNNVGTISYVPHIIEKGARWFRGMGTKKYPGTYVFCVSGHVKRPGLYELPVGSATLREIICDYAGGIRDGHELKAVIPGGSSSPVLTPDKIDVPMTPEAFAIPGGGELRGMFGTGGVIVMDDTVCMVDALLNIMKFYAHESCGQCTPCRDGAPWIRDIVWKIENGQGTEGDLDLLLDFAENVSPFLNGYTTICLFGPSFAWPVIGMVGAFRGEFEDHIRAGRCTVKKDRSIKANY